MCAISKTYNADCMEWLSLQADNSFDLAICDPPYGIGVASMNLGNRQGYVSTAVRLKQESLDFKDWDLEIPTKEYFLELMRVSRNQVIFGGNYFDLPPTRCVIVWDKLQYAESYSQVEIAWTSFDRPSRIFRKGVVGGNNLVKKIHPTEKPVELYGWILKEFAKKGDSILDTHKGSQSSRIAAYKLGFDYYGCEIDRTYYLEGERRFRRECLGEEVYGEKVYTQASLFEL